MVSFPTSINYRIIPTEIDSSLIVTAAREIASSFSREVCTTFLPESTITCPTTPGKLFTRCRTLSRSMQKLFENKQGAIIPHCKHAIQLHYYGTPLLEVGSLLHVLLRHQIQSVHQLHLPLNPLLLPYSQRSRTLRLLSRHLARHSEARQRLHLMPSHIGYIGRGLHRRLSAHQEGANDGRQRASRSSDQRAHLHAVMHYASLQKTAETFDHAISVRHVIHLSGNPNDALVLLRQRLSGVESG